MITGMGMNTMMYRIAVSVLYMVYTMSEVPSNLLMPKLGSTMWMTPNRDLLKQHWFLDA